MLHLYLIAEKGLTPWCCTQFFSHSQFLVHSLLKHSYSPPLQSHGSESVYTNKIPSIGTKGSHTVVWVQENAAHTPGQPLRMKHGCLSDWGIKNGHTHNLSFKKQADYFHKKSNTEGVKTSFYMKTKKKCPFMKPRSHKNTHIF